MTIEQIIEQFTFKKRCFVNDTPDAHTVWLKVDQQSFSLDGYCDTPEEADWLRRQLAIALSRFHDHLSETPRQAPSQKSGGPCCQSAAAVPKDTGAPSTLTASDSPSAPHPVADSSQIPTGRETRPTHDSDDIVP